MHFLVHVALFFAWRLFWSLSCRTFFVPDEHWQSVEVAQWLTSGTGQLTWEWRTLLPIRSATVPLLYALPLFALPSVSPLTLWPLLQAALAALCDALFSRLAHAWLPSARAAQWATALHCTSWALVYCLARPLSNGLETLLSVALLLLLSRNRHVWAAVVMALCVAVRPSSALQCALLALPRLRSFATLSVLLSAAVTLGLTVAVDSLFYGKPTLTALNFVVFNAASASFYGTHPWHWYATNGIPTLLLFSAVFVFIGLFVGRRYVTWDALVFLVFVPVALSFVPHKEFRFLLPSLSVALCFGGVGAAFCWSNGKLGKIVVVLVFALNIAASGYFCFVHQRGPIAATDFLRTRGKLHSGDAVAYVAPCHSIPAHSRLQVPNLRLLTLSCDPLPGAALESPVLDSDVFFEDPHKHVDELLMLWKDAKYFVAFEPMFELLEARGKRKAFESFHAHFPSDRRQGHKIAVFF